MVAIATRRERVILDVESNAVRVFAEGAAGARVFGNALDDLDGSTTSTGNGLDDLGKRTDEVGQKTEQTTKKTRQYTLEMAVAAERDARLRAGLRAQAKALFDGADASDTATDALKKFSTEVDDAGRSTGKAGPEIDRLSGRLRLLSEAAFVLGPALIPLGAGTIPILTASLVGLGAAAGGIGTAVLAFNGLGDALEAAQKYDVERTAENFSAMRVEFEKMGPAGADFVRYLMDLGPELQQLQFLARQGLFPGIEDGINELLVRLPQIKLIVSDLAEGMGALARDAGESLGGPEWEQFFDYIQSDARPTMEAFARSVGNVALGLGNLLVGFAPATRDFTGGMERVTKSFADWTAELDDNQSFQEFVATIRRMGPQAAEFIGAAAQAIAGLIEAAAPVGSAVLPVLTQLARVFAAISSSPVGPPLYAAAAGLIAFNRASKITSGLVDSLAGGFSRVGIEAATMRGKLALIASGGTAAAVGIGSMIDTFDQMDAISRAGDTADATIESLADLQDALNFSNVAKNADQLGINMQRLTDDLAANGEKGEYVQRVMEGLSERTHGLTALGKAYVDHLPFLDTGTEKASDALTDLQTIIDKTGGAAIGAKTGFDGMVDSIVETIGAATDLTAKLSELNGWFDKRDAVINYKNSLDQLAEGFKNGFKRDDLSALNDAGRSIIQVAEKLRGQKRVEFLDEAVSQLRAIGKRGGPEAAAAVQTVIDKFRDKGLVSPPKPKLTVDDSRAQTTIKRNRRDLDILGRSISKPTVSGNDNPWQSIYGKTRRSVASLDGLTGRPTLGARDQASGIIGQIIRALNGLDGKVATTYVRTVRQEFVDPTKRADGGQVFAPVRGQVFGPGGPRDDKVPALLSNREFVQPVAAVEKYGVAFMEDVRTLRFADGGTPDPTPRGGKGKPASPPPMPWLAFFGEGVENAGKGLKGLAAALEKATDAQEKQVDAARDARDAAVARRDALSSSIQQGLGGDLWADIPGTKATMATGNPWALGAVAGVEAGEDMPATPQSALAALRESTAKTKRFIAALNTLRQKGITGPVLQEIIGTGDVDRAEMMAGLDIADLTQFSSAYTENQSALAAAGLAGGDAVEKANIDAANRRLDKQIDELKLLRQDVREVTKAVKDSEKKAKRSREEAADKTAEATTEPAKRARRRARR